MGFAIQGNMHSWDSVFCNYPKLPELKKCVPVSFFDSTYVKKAQGELRPPFKNESEFYCAKIRESARIGKNAKGELADIDNLDKKTKKAVLSIIEYAKTLGYTVEIRTAKRSVTEQKRLLAHNPYAAKVENSHHVIGDAVDLHFYDKKGKKAALNVYYKIGEYAEKELGMRYGNNVKKNKEYWHFDFGKSREDIKLR